MSDNQSQKALKLVLNEMKEQRAMLERILPACEAYEARQEKVDAALNKNGAQLADHEERIESLEKNVKSLQTA